MERHEATAASLLGPLNDVEQKHAPAVLYVAGDRSLLREGARVSVVGSRKASAAGLQRAGKLARLLASRGTVVVSGLAEGIDTAAHMAAIEAGGRTIAVIGTPLDKAYPKQNAGLQERIMREHLVVSQFPVGYPVQPKNFVIRNRSMALVSDATVIIEADDKSGSLHQGWEALRLGRGLFIAKSVVENDSVSWPEKMLHYGARVLSDETLDELFDYLPSRSEGQADGVHAF
jgi:DNA processing protein